MRGVALAILSGTLDWSHSLLAVVSRLYLSESFLCDFSGIFSSRRVFRTFLTSFLQLPGSICVVRIKTFIPFLKGIRSKLGFNPCFYRSICYLL